jgi:serine-type D-Ala-D-Ala carboxypeptidase/endopeptidase (penicillin-binding protein 4)
MKRSLCLLPALALLFPVLAFTAAPAQADLAADVRAVLAGPGMAHVKHSIKLVRLADGGRAVALLDSNATAPMTPASNLKLITTSAALEQLGPGFKFRTLLLQHDGDLILVGDGDPSFGDAELLKKSGWDAATVFQTWAAGLAARKIGPVRRVLVDDSVFDTQFLHPDWPADQAQTHYMAEVAGMNLNVNCLDFFIKPSAGGSLVHYLTDPHTSFFSIKNTCVTGSENRVRLTRVSDNNDFELAGEANGPNDVPISRTIHDPPMYAAAVLAESLEAAGVSVGGIARDRTARQHYVAQEAGWTLVAENQTPLTTVMARANKDSMNLYAECLSKRLGFAVSGQGSWAAGTAAVGQFLTRIGVPGSEYNIVDGCGLSRQDAISANLMTSVLEHDFYGPNAKTFMDTMAVVGVDGTMEDRFKGSDLRGRVFAKSGYINAVSCLSGYLHARDGGWYAFSILFNDVAVGDGKTAEEKIVHALDVESVGGR